MPYIDPDNPNAQLIAQITRYYDHSAQILKDIVLHPPGRSAQAQAYNQATAASRLAQVQAEIDRLKKTATSWTGTALDDCLHRGLAVADEQLGGAGVPPADLKIKRSTFSMINRHAVEVLARDTVGDLHKAADSMGQTAKAALRGMAATGVTNAQVNALLAGRQMIEGRSDFAARELRQLLQRVHGKTVVIQGKKGPIEFDTKYYADLVCHTKAREATCFARHERFIEHGIYVVKIIGRVSKNFCTAFLGHVYSIDARDTRYPQLESLPGGGPPFHPNCSKSTAPFIESLASAAARNHSHQDDQAAAVAAAGTTSAAQKIFRETHGSGAAEQRQRESVQDIRDRARATGYEPPAWGPKGGSTDDRSIK